MKDINSIQFIDSLAEITRHRDREIIEHSLLRTLLEYDPSFDYWLYRVMAPQPEVTLGLLAYASHKDIVTAEHIRKHELPQYVHEAVIEVINTGKIVTADNNPEDPERKIIYPAFNANDEIFAVLIQSTDTNNYERQRLIHGFLRIYSNYLELIEITKRDKLTGLLNRETLESEITRILIQNASDGKPMAPPKALINNDARTYKGELTYWLGVLDIDFFKSINDNYGHLYGDEILILVARLMEESVRSHDLVFRYGGEEFVILLRAYDLNDALAAFERIRTTIRNHNFAKIEKLTVSQGVRQILNQPGSAEVIAEADAALYYAKEHGRDQIQVYEILLAEGKIEAKTEEFESGGVQFF